MMHVGDLTKMCNESYWILVHWLVKCEMHLCTYVCMYVVCTHVQFDNSIRIMY